MILLKREKLQELQGDMPATAFADSLGHQPFTALAYSLRQDLGGRELHREVHAALPG
jgi:hypothetical protein